MSGNRGAISVFLCIITAAMILLTGVLIDFARAFAAEAEAREALDLSMRSTLAGYDKMLKDMYGLFALANNDADVLREELLEYYSKTLMVELGIKKNDLTRLMEIDPFLEKLQSLNNSLNVNSGFADMYDFAVDDLSIVPIYNLTEDEILRSQILQYMKYRAPKELAEGFVDKLLCIKEQAQLSQPIKKKNDIDRSLSDMWKYFEKLNDSMKTIKTFQKPVPETAIYTLKTALEEVALLQEQINSLSNLEGTEEFIAALSKALSIAVSTLNKQKSYVEAYIAMFTEPMNTAINAIDSIQSKGKEISIKIDELNLMVKNDSSDSAKSIRDEAIANAKKIDPLAYNALCGELRHNLKILNELRATINSAQTPAALDNCITLLSSYKDVEISKFTETVSKKASTGSGMYDFKNDIENIKSSLKENSDNNISIAKSELASTQIKKSPSFDTEDAQLGLTPPFNYTSKSNNKNLTNISDINSSADSKYCDNIMDYMNDIGDIIKNKALNLKDEIYINEYIIGMFKNSVDMKKNITTSTDLTGRLFSEKSSKMNSELEYIINGKLNQAENEAQVKLKILYLRFAMNLIHILTNHEKLEITRVAATAAAGISIIGVPILQGVLILSWAMAESVQDLKILMDDGSVPLVKTKEDWILNPQGIAREYSQVMADYSKKREEEKVHIASTNADEPNQKKKDDALSRLLSMDYKDYLRLLLITVNSKDKLYRIMDLIQLNLRTYNSYKAFTLSECNTYLRVDASVSIKYMFAARLFNLKRHNIRVVQYLGY